MDARLSPEFSNAAAGGDAANRYRIVNYVPGQVCIVLHCDRVPSDADLPGLYEKTLNLINTQLARSLSEDKPPQRLRYPAEIERDVSPMRLRRLARDANRPVLVPLEPVGAIQASQVFPRRSGEAVVLHFFGIGPRTGNDPDDEEVVRELVNAINDPLGSHAYVPDKRVDDHCVVEAATPNWYVPASEHTCGGPGGEPAPVPPGAVESWTFGFSDLCLRILVNGARQFRRAGQPTPPSDVVVAVLDTCPSVEQVRNAAAAYGAANWLLHDVVVGNPMSIGESPSIAYSASALTANWRGALCDPARDPHHYRMPDHGLFVSGIIRDVAPAAEIHLIRALDDYGVGTVQGLTHVLSRVLRRWGNGAKKLIVNLSLMADLPTYSPLAPPGAQRLLRRWFPAAFQAGILGSGDANEPRWLADPTARDAVQRVLGYVHRSLFDVVEALVDHQVLVVAAAGNDGNLGGLHPNPRFPAAYDSVLGVAALARRDAPASPPLLARYTNLGDEAVPIPIQTGVSVFPNGVAVWGGNSVLTRVCADNDDASRIDLAVRPVDAVRGIFSSPVVPITGALNRTGWVYWVGTSFATPVITAIAADTWAALPDLSAADVANAIRTTFSSGTIETTYPGAGPGPLSFPFIDAFQ